MKNFTKHIVYTFTVAIAVTAMFSCKGKKNATLVDMRNEDSMVLVNANRIADSIAKANFKPDTTNRLDTAKLLSSNPDFAFVHNCYKSNCQQMEVIHFGIVNGFDKKIKNASKGMMGDYAKLNAQLKDYAVRNNVPLSTDTTIDLSFANSMDGTTWDSTWIDMVIRDQTAMMADFVKAQNTVKDPTLQSVINGHMPAINKHIEVAANLKKVY